MVWERLASASVSSSLLNNSWKELKRATVSSGDTLDTSTFTAKDNMMILCYTVGSNTVHPKLHFNNDDDDNYAFRYSASGVADGTPSTDQNYFRIQGGISGSPQQFSVSSVVNASSQEKLIISHLISNQTDGAGNLPTREENFGKWTNTSAQINRVDCNNGQSGDYASGTELIVLGFDNDDDGSSGTNFWQELGSTELTSAGDNVTVNFTSKKYLMVEAYMVGGSGNNFRNAWKLNGVDSGSTYAYRKSSNGAGDNTYINRNKLEIGDQDQTHDSYQKLFIVNQSGKEKLGIMHAVREENDSASDPSRTEAVFKWTTTSGQINSITAHNDQTGNFGVGSYVKVYGAD